MSNQSQKIKLTSDGEKAIATTLGNLCTSEQLQKIKALSERLEINRSEMSLFMFGYRYDELSRSGAEDVIEILETKVSENKKAPRFILLKNL